MSEVKSGIINGSPTTVRLIGVRLAFPSLFEPTDYENDGKFAYRASFLFPKTVDGKPSLEAQLMANAVKEACKKKYTDKADAKLAAYKANGKIWALRDGDIKASEKETYAAYAGCYVVGARSKVAPAVVDSILAPDGKPKKLTKADGRPYSGCYVNAVVEVYAYDSAGGGVSCELKGVQFNKDGDALGGGAPLSPDAFSDLAVSQEETGQPDDGSLF